MTAVDASVLVSENLMLRKRKKKTLKIGYISVKFSASARLFTFNCIVGSATVSTEFQVDVVAPRRTRATGTRMGKAQTRSLRGASSPSYTALSYLRSVPTCESYGHNQHWPYKDNVIYCTMKLRIGYIFSRTLYPNSLANYFDVRGRLVHDLKNYCRCLFCLEEICCLNIKDR